MSATVYLVGAGPGDPGLLTVRGRELLKRADIVIYDYLANPALLADVPDTAVRIYAGKKGYASHITQGEINDILIEAARSLEERANGTVVRLKGGDPYVFGRGGEEALALSQANIPFEVVPGITSAIAGAAYAGIPVTHRGISSSVTLVTGHEDPAKEASAIGWPALAQLVYRGGTVCFYMGMRDLGEISGHLIGEGVDPATPVAIIEHGTEARQRVLETTLDEAPEAAAREGLAAPAVILVGAVASLRGELAWFEQKPLSGKRIAVTRSRTQASALSRRLSELGADVLEFPTIAIAPPDDFAPLDAACARIPSYDWVVFTSVNGIDAFFERLQGDARALGGVLVAAIGPATAERLGGRGIAADAVPSEYRGEAVFDAIAEKSKAEGVDLASARILIPRAADAREALPDLLRKAGAQVDVVAAYRTVAPADADADARHLADALAAGGIDAVTFTSSSTARNLAALLDDAPSRLAGAVLCSIGPVTSETMRTLGFAPQVEAAEYTIDGLVAVICGHFTEG